MISLRGYNNFWKVPSSPKPHWHSPTHLTTHSLSWLLYREYGRSNHWLAPCHLRGPGAPAPACCKNLLAAGTSYTNGLRDKEGVGFASDLASLRNYGIRNYWICFRPACTPVWNDRESAVFYSISTLCIIVWTHDGFWPFYEQTWALWKRELLTRDWTAAVSGICLLSNIMWRLRYPGLFIRVVRELSTKLVHIFHEFEHKIYQHPPSLNAHRFSPGPMIPEHK